MFALSYINLTYSDLAFEQIFISSFRETTLVSISAKWGLKQVISLDSSNNWTYVINMPDISSIPEVNLETINPATS